MIVQFNSNPKLKDFDSLWGLGDPVEIEKEFNKLLPAAEAEADKSIYLQILSQIALTQALQKKFHEAHETLNKAESLIMPECILAQVRILLERGRVFHQAEKIDPAKRYFEQAFELGEKYGFDFHAIDAAHMLAIIANTIKEKIHWNERALRFASKTKELRARGWFGPLYNNLGQNYIEAKQFKKALSMFKKALECRKKEGYPPNIRVAKWAIGRALRLLDRLDEALAIQLSLQKEYDTLVKSSNIDVPLEMFTLTRGWVYEEIAEIYAAKAKYFAHLAYEDLSNNDMFKNTEPQRLERLKQLSA